MNTIDKLSIDTIRVLSAEAIQKANSGHPGMPIGAAPIAYAIWKNMNHNPKDPSWRGRDRFILSAGHASMLEYSLLHLYGYDVSMDDIKQFRQLGSKTPGHPEFGHTCGVEATTGPLGQGFAMAVGMAIAESHLSAKFNRAGFNVVDNYTYVLTGDGCMEEGVSGEAASLAGTLKLNKLIAVYDRNRITIEGSTDLAFSENVAARFGAYGWQVITVDDGNDLDSIENALHLAKRQDKPTLIIVDTKIAYGSPKEGMNSAHGSPLGEENIRLMKQKLGFDYDEPFTVPAEVYANFSRLAEKCAEPQSAHAQLMKAYKTAFPALYKEWEEYHAPVDVESLINDREFAEFDEKVATRAASGKILNLLARHIPNMFGGSADLAPSNVTEIKGEGYYGPDSPEYRNIHFGIREFAMAAICNGIMLYGGLHAYCATFLVFADYLKPALRLSALMKLPVIYVLTHDSIGVGEDGPTHQPIEQLASLRATPNTRVFRPADGKETCAAYMSALNADCPTVLALSRQGLPTLEATSFEAMRGGYVIKAADGAPDVILIASGSEVELALKAAPVLEEKGIRTQVVSMPCMELFDAQSDEYKESVLPKAVRARVSIEAASSFGWQKYTGLDGANVSLDTFGASAPAGKLFELFGFTVQNVVDTAIRTVDSLK